MEPTNRSVRFFHQASKHVRTHGRENARSHEREKGVSQIGKCLRENCLLIILSYIFCTSFSCVFFFFFVSLSVSLIILDSNIRSVVHGVNLFIYSSLYVNT